MRALIQRVTEAHLLIHRKSEKRIGPGIVVLLGIEETDGKEDIDWLSGKISRLRIFDDYEGVMNLSLKDTGGEVMIVSQFTLYASTKKGNRPSYIRAASPNIAVPLYQEFIAQLETDAELSAVIGEFGAHMLVSLTNDGPVTIMIDTKNRE